MSLLCPWAPSASQWLPLLAQDSTHWLLPLANAHTRLSTSAVHMSHGMTAHAHAFSSCRTLGSLVDVVNYGGDAARSSILDHGVVVPSWSSTCIQRPALGFVRSGQRRLWERGSRRGKTACAGILSAPRPGLSDFPRTGDASRILSLRIRGVP